jgi:hypothetical protein
VTIRVFGKGANRCAGSAAAGYVLVTQTFSQAHKQHHSSEPCYQYPEPPDKSPGGISRQLEATEPPAPRLPLFLEARATTQAAYRDLRVAHVRGPPSQTGGTDSDIDVLCDTGFLPAPQLNLTTYSAPSRVSDPADWDEDLKIGRTLETGPEIVFAPRVKLRPPRVSFLVECGPIERGLEIGAKLPRGERFSQLHQARLEGKEHINRPAGLLLADHEEDCVNCGRLEPL